LCEVFACEVFAVVSSGKSNEPTRNKILADTL